MIADFICKLPLPPEDEQFHRDAMFVAHLHSLPAYEDIIRAAGFVLEETREITPHTRRMSVVGQDILSEKREELRQAFGDEILAALDVSWNRASELGRKHNGYALFRMRKP